MLSALIGRIEGTIFQRHAWLFALITGLALALFNNQPLICRQQFLIIATFVTIVFWIADAIQRVPVHRAIKRSGTVEKALRENNDLSTPVISDEVSDGKDFKDFIHCLIRFRVWFPYVATLLAALIFFLIAP